jgi:hypothetical protein
VSLEEREQGRKNVRERVRKNGGSFREAGELAMTTTMLQRLREQIMFVREAVLDNRDGDAPMLPDKELEQFEWLTSAIDVELAARLKLVDEIEALR